jgi:hypothetical protein
LTGLLLTGLLTGQLLTAGQQSVLLLTEVLTGGSRLEVDRLTGQGLSGRRRR